MNFAQMAVLDVLKGFFSSKSAVSSGDEMRATSNLSNPNDWFMEWINGGKPVAGQSVTPQTALKLSAVYAATNLLCRTMASLSVGQFKKIQGGGSDEIYTPESFAVCVEPNSMYTSYDWRSTAMLHICFRGNAYSKIHFDRSGRADGFEILHPDKVYPFKYNGKLYYEVYDDDNKKKVYESGEILHFKNFSDDGIVGKSPLACARETIGMALAANDYAAAMYENGGGLRGIVTHPATLNDPQITAMRKHFLDVMRNYRDTGSIGVLQGGADFKQISLSPKDAQFIESSKLSVADISRFYGVPLHLIGDLERSTNNNIEHQSIEFVMHTVRPIVKSWEAEINRKAIRKSDRQLTFFRFNMDSLLRGDSQARAEYYSKMISQGVYNLDEVRALENMNPIPDGMGKKHYIQVNMTTLENINNEPHAENNNDDGQASTGSAAASTK